MSNGYLSRFIFALLVLHQPFDIEPREHYVVGELWVLFSASFSVKQSYGSVVKNSNIRVIAWPVIDKFVV